MTREQIEALERSIETTLRAKDEVIATQQKIIALQEECIKAMRNELSSAFEDFKKIPALPHWPTIWKKCYAAMFKSNNIGSAD